MLLVGDYAIAYIVSSFIAPTSSDQ